MAIVEDEVRNESEEENEIEVVVEEDNDSDDSDDEEDEILERKVEELELRIAENPFNYDDHIELIQALWGLSELDRWRCAFDRLQQLSIIRAEHWLHRLQTEVTLGHTGEVKQRIADMFQQAALDCYSIPILSEWCTWSLGEGEEGTRAHLDEILRRAAADPAAGIMFWDAKLEFEKELLDNMSTEAELKYKTQQERVLHCMEEAVSRPLLRAVDAWPSFYDLATTLRDDTYINKVKKQHEAAKEYLEQIAQFEEKILITENVEEKCSLYQDYIEKVKELSREEKFAECDSDGILKVLYDRATTECVTCSQATGLLTEFATHTRACSSRATYNRVLDICTRRRPTLATFWVYKMQQAEHEGKTFDEVKSIFEQALSKGMKSFKEAESLWMAYLEYLRRRTHMDNETEVDTLRRNFRLAWDSLAEVWGDEANDCDVPLFWARLEYRRFGNHANGKDIFEEIFKYGENKTLSKYWVPFISLESTRDPPPSENKLRELYKRALRFVTDYPPIVAEMWIEYEREYGQLTTARDCADACQAKLKEWRETYKTMKEKMMGKAKGKQPQKKKSKFDKRNKREDDKPKNKGKRKSAEQHGGSEVKRKKDEDMEVETKEEDGESGGVKRSHEEEGHDEGASCSKRARTDSESSATRQGTRDACILFVSNLEFKVDEQKLRDELSKYGDIVSLRVKAGVKAFGGSICYCQYKTPESVEEALKHDRTPLDGRPMFLSRYSAKKVKQSFKYSTTEEKNKLFVKNLPYGHCTKDELGKIFDKYGKLKDVRIVTFKDGKPKGLAYIEYEDEKSAAEALDKTNGLVLADRKLEVAFSAPPPRKKEEVTTLGQQKREVTGGMRRTQLSSFIPSVLAKPSTSTASTSNGSANGSANSSANEKRPLSNSDFRNMLLKK